MKKIIFGIITLIFLISAGVFTYIHFQADIKPLNVEANVTATFNPTIDNSFIEGLKTRESEQPITDLTY